MIGTIELPLEVLERIRLSEEECEDLTVRELRCPYCDFLIDFIFSDASGHRRSKCPKCKRVLTMNVAYFRRVKRKVYLEPKRSRHYIR